MPLVSVIVPSFNMGWYLNDLLGSLYGGKTSLGEMSGQTLADFETVIVDDASTDNTDLLIPALKKKFPKWGEQTNAYLRLEHDQQGRHKTAAMNHGIRNATGEYITILDADDMMAPTRLEKMVQVCRDHPHVLVYDDVQWFEHGKFTEVTRFSDYDFIKLRESNLFHVGFMYPKAAWAEVGGYPEEMGDGRDDWAMGVRLGVHGWCGVHLGEPLYLYRREGQGRTHRNTSPGQNQAFYERIRKLHPEAYQDPLPDGCCGKRVTIKSGEVVNVFVPPPQLQEPLKAVEPPKPRGPRMVRLKYIGGNAGTQRYLGLVTKRPYDFGGFQPYGDVDERDVDKFLNPDPGKKPLFERA